MKTEHAGKVFEIHPISIHPIIEDTLQSIETMARAKGKTIINRVDPSVKVRSSNLFFQVLLFNLLDNAIKHSEAGFIALSTKRERASVTLILQHQTTSIIDHQKINAFFTEAPEKDQPALIFSNTEGIGLYIIRDIGRKNHLKISLLPNKHGSVYEIIFPA